MADARRILKSVMLIKQICVTCSKLKCHLKRKQASQNMKFVMTIFFLEIDFLQFSKDLQYSMSYV